MIVTRGAKIKSILASANRNKGSDNRTLSFYPIKIRENEKKVVYAVDDMIHK